MALRMGTLFNPALTKAMNAVKTITMATTTSAPHSPQKQATIGKNLTNATNGGVDIELLMISIGDPIQLLWTDG